MKLLNLKSLELKIPPVIVVLITAAIMWLIASPLPGLPLPDVLRWAALIIGIIAGAGISLAGVISFKRASTTVNPMIPSASSSLVTSGIYRYTRNPMYLGFLVALAGWGIYLASMLALIFAWLYTLYMDRFQIEPEERALNEKFGEAFQHYQKQVKRWLW
ncbi:methyltransferase family protein [Nitrincola alkalilacustris]|uniref:methyltransferase family protein n=1 Tax=Nitrincola alkalilacustris TaxID=1571224 RepID=UPI001F0FFF62|nr:isoprenylcysteine carboxylmethyltransferase family protein [Nitrincola alkalilacustris]